MDSDNEPHSSNKDEQQLTSPQAATIPKSTKGNGKVGKSNYTREELLSLFAIMERILPIGTEEWEQVQMEHSQEYPGRDVESIRRKYNTLHRKQVPTGNPNISPEILAAKRVKRKIGDKADIGGGDDEIFDLENGFSDSSGSDGPHRPEGDGNGGVPVSVETTTPTIGQAHVNPQPQQRPHGNTQAHGNTQGQKRSSGPESSNLSVVSSRVPRKCKDANQEFLDMWRMQMMMEQEERRQDRRETRKRQEEMAGFITALVGGIAQAFGVQPPSSNGNKKRKRKEHNSSDDESDP